MNLQKIYSTDTAQHKDRVILTEIKKFQHQLTHQDTHINFDNIMHKMTKPVSQPHESSFIFKSRQNYSIRIQSDFPNDRIKAVNAFSDRFKKLPINELKKGGSEGQIQDIEDKQHPRYLDAMGFPARKKVFLKKAFANSKNKSPSFQSQVQIPSTWVSPKETNSRNKISSILGKQCALIQSNLSPLKEETTASTKGQTKITGNLNLSGYEDPNDDLLRSDSSKIELDDLFKEEPEKKVQGYSLTRLNRRKRWKYLYDNEIKMKNTHNQLRPKQTTSRLNYGCILKDLEGQDATEENISFFEIHDILLTDSEHRKNEIPQKLFSGLHAHAISVLYCNGSSVQFLYGRRNYEKVEIASITKVMTCLLAIKIAEKFRIDMKEEKVTLSQKAAKMPGTSARLEYSDICSVHDLLHGLMLPSGNDAAVAIGEWGGRTIRKQISNLKRQFPDLVPKRSNIGINLQQESKSYLKLFLFHMNKAAKFLQLSDTFYANTHGLMNQKSHSTAEDVSKIAYLAMCHPLFKEIVKKIEFDTVVNNRTYSVKRSVKWVNTNKLLRIKGFTGIKTGITHNAGPCLVSNFSISASENVIVTVLATKTMQKRFEESLEVVKRTLSYLASTKKDHFSRYKSKLDYLVKCHVSKNIGNIIEEEELKDETERQ